MDLSTLIGLLLGIFGLLGGFLFEGGSAGALIQGTAALIVFGGTFGAVIAGTPLKKLKRIPYILKLAFVEKKYSPHEMIDQLVELSTLSRREGLLALEAETEKFENDSFLFEGLQMTIDGMDGELIRDILDREIELFERQHLEVAKAFEAAGGYAPTMGIIGTVMGLVHVLGNLDDPKSLGPLIATAFIATLYGVASANVIYLPLFNKIKARIEQEIVIKELQAEALLSIQHGENPNILRKKLVAFVDKEVPAKGKNNENDEEEQVEESEAM
ncbi:MAG TPA: flagellar motor protein [Bacillales bacterium]|nr:flagellar motor protein [Bacillales bacterium]